MKLNTVKRFYDNGQLCEEYTEDNTCLQGGYKGWWANGTLRAQCEYTNGIRHGNRYIWQENGELDNCNRFFNGLCIIDVNYRVCPVLISILADVVDLESTKFLADVITQLSNKGKEYDITYE